jgi:hypothetical protein
MLSLQAGHWYYVYIKESYYSLLARIHCSLLLQTVTAVAGFVSQCLTPVCSAFISLAVIY